MTRIRHVAPSLRHLFDPLKTPLERAFEIARSGEVANLTTLVSRLNAEGYNTLQVNGSALRKQLTKLIEASQTQVEC